MGYPLAFRKTSMWLDSPPRDSIMTLSGFINFYSLVDPRLEGACYAWSSHEKVLILSHIDRFLFSVDWEHHFQGFHQVVLRRITSDHVLTLLHGVILSSRRRFKFENVWLEVEGFSDLVKVWWDELDVSPQVLFWIRN